MIAQPSHSYAPDAVRDESAGEHTFKACVPFHLDGTLYLPQTEVMTSLSRTAEGRHSVDVGLARGGVGVFVSFTPDGARAFAAKMLESADEIDAMLATQATDAIAKARKQGGAA